MLTFNNPSEHSVNHDSINAAMREINCVYYCMCDEIGEKNTPHIHLYFYCKNAISFEKVKKLFPSAHIEIAHGTSRENRDYIRKEGKYLNSQKKETNIIDTFEEYGEMPLDNTLKKERMSSQVLKMIKDGCSTAEIIETFPSFRVPQIEQMRQAILEDEYADKWRDVELIYIYGKTGVGKTRYIMDNYDFRNVYKITNYKNPFDGYSQQPVILFDEFRSSIPLTEMLQYTDGYPCRLPARYADKTACYTKVFIVSNIPLEKQFTDIQHSSPESWNAFIRRMNRVVEFREVNGEVVHISIPVGNYFRGNSCV